MQVKVAEKRFSPRVEINSSIGMLPNNLNVQIINISETGICFECDGNTLSGEISLSLALSPPGSTKRIDSPARIIWYAPIAENRIQCGAQFSLLDEMRLSQIRTLMFDRVAKKASHAIENGKDLKRTVEEFFKKNVKEFHESLSALAYDAKHGNINSDTIEKRVMQLTDEVLIKGYELDCVVNNEAAMKTIKQVFREIAGCWFYKSPIVKMAYDKPRGYPGDYYLFDIIYDNRSKAEPGSIGYYCDKYFLNNTYAQAARCRKNKMKNILQDLIENSSSTTIKLLNVACGPSREIRELFCDPYLANGKNLIFTGLDNDEESLKFSESKLSNLAPNIQTRLLHANVLNIFRDPKYYELIGKQDIIYILGLTEYLPDRIFRKLTQFLFRLLNDKGMLVITYKDEEIKYPSLPPEWFCDWTFIKRTKEDLMKTAKEIGSDKFSLKIEREGTGTIFFFVLTKE